MEGKDFVFYCPYCAKERKEACVVCMHAPASAFVRLTTFRSWR
jgi:hypothetical protein